MAIIVPGWVYYPPPSAKSNIELFNAVVTSIWLLICYFVVFFAEVKFPDTPVPPSCNDQAVFGFGCPSRIYSDQEEEVFSISSDINQSESSRDDSELNQSSLSQVLREIAEIGPC